MVMSGRDLALTHCFVRRLNGIISNFQFPCHVIMVYKHVINIIIKNMNIDWISNPNAMHRSSHAIVQIERLICVCFHPDLTLNANIIYFNNKFQLIRIFLQSFCLFVPFWNSEKKNTIKRKRNKWRNRKILTSGDPMRKCRLNVLRWI